MVISIIKSAVAGGAVAANYVRADQLLMEQDRVCGVHATDTETGESLQIRARMTVNATGPWLSQLLSTLGKGAAATVTTGFSVGSHLVTRQLIRDHAIAIPTEFRGDSKLDRGGRHIFILPWRGHSLIGTSYVAAKSGIDDLRVQPEEIDQLVGSIQQKLPGLELTMQDIVHSFSGIYPLQSMDIEHNTYQGTGEYQIIDHEEQDGVHGMVSSLGAKYTTARRIASKTVDLALKRLDEPARACRSHRIPLLGGDIDNIDTYIDRKQREYADILSGAAVAHLVCYFGSGIDDIAAMVRKRPRTAHELGVELSNTEAEIDWVVKHEMCLHLDDLLYRRTGIGTIGDPGDDIIGRCADIMGEHLGWDEETRQREIDRVRDHYVFSP